MNPQSIHQIRRTVKSTQANVFPTNKDHSAYGQEVVCRPLDTQPDRNKASEYAIVSYRIQSDNLRWDRGSGASAAPSPVSRPVVMHQPPEPALLIEHRDEVFARLAADLLEHGLRAVRAASADEGQKAFRMYKPCLVIANIGLLDHSAWLFAAKLRLTEPAVPIWLYQPASTPSDFQMAWFLKIDELLDYGGNLFDLSRKVWDRLARNRQSYREANGL